MAYNAYQKRKYAMAQQLQPAEKALINLYELHWMLGHRVPSVEEVTAELRKKMPKIRQTSVNYYLMRPPVIKALDQRGIPWRQHSQEELTGQQQAAALTVMNMMDTRSIPEKLDSIGVLPATYYAWLNDPVFKNFVDALTEQNKLNIRPTAVTEFTKKINQGDWQAIKYWLDATGEFNNSEAPRSEVLIGMIIEIIQKHVKDPELLLAIANEMMSVMSNKTYDTSHILEGEVTDLPVAEDVDLDFARKQLGV